MLKPILYESPRWGKSNPRIQILTIEQLLHGAQVQMPPAHGTFKQAQKIKTDEGVQASLDGQDILIQHTDTGHRLARLLQPEAARTVLRGHTVFWRVSHNRAVDALLVELIDLFISIRYAHPALVQLELALSESELPIPEPAAP